MLQIKKFIDLVSRQEGRQGRDVVLPLAEARVLRDEIAKLLVDKLAQAQQPPPDDVIAVEVHGGKF